MRQFLGAFAIVFMAGVAAMASPINPTKAVTPLDANCNALPQVGINMNLVSGYAMSSFTVTTPGIGQPGQIGYVPPSTSTCNVSVITFAGGSTMNVRDNLTTLAQ